MLMAFNNRKGNRSAGLLFLIQAFIHIDKHIQMARWTA